MEVQNENHIDKFFLANNMKDNVSGNQRINWIPSPYDPDQDPILDPVEDTSDSPRKRIDQHMEVT